MDRIEAFLTIYGIKFDEDQNKLMEQDLLTLLDIEIDEAIIKYKEYIESLLKLEKFNKEHNRTQQEPTDDEKNYIDIRNDIIDEIIKKHKKCLPEIITKSPIISKDLLIKKIKENSYRLLIPGDCNYLTEEMIIEIINEL